MTDASVGAATSCASGAATSPRVEDETITGSWKIPMETMGKEAPGKYSNEFRNDEKFRGDPHFFSAQQWKNRNFRKGLWIDFYLLIRPPSVVHFFGGNVVFFPYVCDPRLPNTCNMIDVCVCVCVCGWACVCVCVCHPSVKEQHPFMMVFFKTPLPSFMRSRLL